MVTMTDTADLDHSTCCMRKNVTPRDQIHDGLNANVALLAIYFAAYASGYNLLCIASFMSILLNSMHILAVSNKEYRELTNQDTSLDESMDSSDREENLSLKQREQGATVAKPMPEEDEIILNSRFQQVVEETQRRNEQRLIPRTPTNTSLNEEDDDDMPPLVSINYSENISTIPHCPACIHHYNNLIPVDPPILRPYISTIREIISNRNNSIHGIEEI
jgi:hypothetical protein